MNLTQLAKIHRSPDAARVDLKHSFLTVEEASLFAPQDALDGRRKAAAPPWSKYTSILHCRFPEPSEGVWWRAEEDFSRAVAKWKRENMYAIPFLKSFHHLPNENSHKKAGVTAGMPDWHWPLPSNKYAGLWIELKSGKGEPSAAQVGMIRILESMGHYCVVVWDSLQAVIEEVEGYLHEKE